MVVQQLAPHMGKVLGSIPGGHPQRHCSRTKWCHVLPLGGALSEDTKVNASFFSHLNHWLKITAEVHGAELSPEISSNSSYRV